MESVGGVAAVGAGIGQRADRFEVFDERTGQPWVRISGRASGSGDCTWRKWIVWPSMSVVNCGKA